MAVKDFLSSGIRAVDNRLRKRLDENFAELEGRLNQLLHGGVYELQTNTATTIALANTAYIAKGGFTAIGDNFGFTVDGTDAKFTHAHTEPTGTTHFYTIQAFIHLSATNNDVIITRVRHWDDSAGSYTNLNTHTEQVTATGGGNFEEKFLVNSIARLDDGDRVEIWLENSTTNTITLLKDTSIYIKGT